MISPRHKRGRSSGANLQHSQLQKAQRGFSSHREPGELRGHATRRTTAQKYAPSKYPLHSLPGIKKTLDTQWKGRSQDDELVCERHKLKPNIRLVKSHQPSAALKGSFNLRVCVSDVLSLLFPVDEHQNCLTRHSKTPPLLPPPPPSPPPMLLPPVYASYLLGQSCRRCPSDSPSLRWPGGWWKARSRPARGGPDRPPSVAPGGCDQSFGGRQKEAEHS